MRDKGMRVRLGVLLVSGIAGFAVVVLVAQGPLTPAANLQTRTDASGYLLTTGAAYTAPDGPLTPMANLRMRTDSNGYLLTTTSASASNLFFAADGTSGAPSYAFASEPTLGFYRSGAGAITDTGILAAANIIRSDVGLQITGLVKTSAPADGNWAWTRNAADIGVRLKFDALPTIASGFGTSPAVTAGSTPLAGSVNVGTGGVATTGTVTFGGTAFPSAPFCTYSDSTSNIVTRGTPTTTTLVLNATTPWLGSDIVSWICVSSK